MELPEFSPKLRESSTTGWQNSCIPTIELVEFGYSPGRCGEIASVIDHVVGRGETLFPAGLGSEDTLHLIAAQAVAGHDPGDLGFARAIDHRNPVHPLAVTARLDQQWHHQDHIRRLGGSDTFVAKFPDHRVQNGLQRFAFGRIGKHPAAHGGAIKSAPGGGNSGAELRDQVGHCNAAWPGEFVRDNIGIDDIDAKLLKYGRDSTLSATDSAGQADNQASGIHWLLDVAQSPMAVPG